jgi:hypothetical protein
MNKNWIRRIGTSFPDRRIPRSIPLPKLLPKADFSVRNWRIIHLLISDFRGDSRGVPCGQNPASRKQRLVPGWMGQRELPRVHHSNQWSEHHDA